jgi:hypothetical protein
LTPSGHVSARTRSSCSGPRTSLDADARCSAAQRPSAIARAGHRRAEQRHQEPGAVAEPSGALDAQHLERGQHGVALVAARPLKPCRTKPGTQVDTGTGRDDPAVHDQETQRVDGLPHVLVARRGRAERDGRTGGVALIGPRGFVGLRVPLGSRGLVGLPRVGRGTRQPGGEPWSRHHTTREPKSHPPMMRDTVQTAQAISRRTEPRSQSAVRNARSQIRGQKWPVAVVGPERIVKVSSPGSWSAPRLYWAAMT